MMRQSMHSTPRTSRREPRPIDRRAGRRQWPRQRGLTLIEALAGTLILAWVAASALVAAGRLEIQRGLASMRLEASAVADGLLDGWWANRDKLPRNSSGTAGADGEWTWVTRVVPNEDAAVLGAEVVALEVFRIDGTNGTNETDRIDRTDRTDGVGDARRPLARVEFMLPLPAGTDVRGGEAP